METAAIAERFTCITPSEETLPNTFARDVEDGLSQTPKHLPCQYFYDHEGSRLFEKICELPEYYLTRAEREILESRSDEIASLFPDGAAIVELGSGSAVKTRLLIESFLRRQNELRYEPIDISRTMIEESSFSLLKEYPELEINAVAGDYAEGLEELHAREQTSKLILWLGSSAGNFDRSEAGNFLATVCGKMTGNDRLLIGIDLRKNRSVLERAYDDEAGVTARFNLNMLARINRELGGNFDLGSFDHRADYDRRMGRVEMHLVSRKEQSVLIDDLSLKIPFAENETIHTESSYKYSLEEIESLLGNADMQSAGQWFDSDRRFSLTLAAPTDAPRES